MERPFLEGWWTPAGAGLLARAPAPRLPGRPLASQWLDDYASCGALGARSQWRDRAGFTPDFPRPPADMWARSYPRALRPAGEPGGHEHREPDGRDGESGGDDDGGGVPVGVAERVREPSDDERQRRQPREQRGGDRERSEPERRRALHRSANGGRGGASPAPLGPAQVRPADRRRDGEGPAR